MKLTITTVEYSTLGSSNPGADVCGVCKSQLERTNKFYKPLAEMLGAFFMEAHMTTEEYWKWIHENVQ